MIIIIIIKYADPSIALIVLTRKIYVKRDFSKH